MSNPVVSNEFADRLLDQVDAIIQACEERNRPLEMEPARGDLFDLFVAVESAGLVDEESDPDLSADGLCQALADRWGLKSAARDSVQQQSAIPPEQLARMRSLWSVMRMWMEWTYAWKRWPEFHPSSSPNVGNSPPDEVDSDAKKS